MIDLSTIDARKQLAGKYAAKYSLDTALLCALCDHESSWNPYAARYEPAFYSRYIQPLLNNGTVHTATEATLRAMSVGLMQLMGEVAREFGYTGDLLRMTDPDTALEWGCRKLRKCFDSASNDPHQALLLYNGGGDPNYPDLVMDLVAKYQ